MQLKTGRVASIQGTIRPPSDKSLTHRAYMLAAAADGPCIIHDPLRGQDCEATLRCLGQLGVSYKWMTETEVVLRPTGEWKTPAAPLDCGNSGTTIRLLSGMIASRPIEATLVGDASLSKRPMKRIVEPLSLMGAAIEGDTSPLKIIGGRLNGIDYATPVPSAQIKSCILLAGLRADGETTVREAHRSRDHTERMLDALGVPVVRKGSETLVDGGGLNVVTVQPTDPLSRFQFRVPGDLSSAAFFMVAAALLPGSDLIIRELCMNDTRTGILDVFEEVGIRFESDELRSELGEPIADLRARFCPDPKPFKISGELVPRLIDEIPILAVLATQCDGVTEIRDAQELRVKESDRIELIAGGLRSMGAHVETFEDGLAVSGPTRLRGAAIDASGDHRIAMAFAVAGLIADGETFIEGADTIATSFPNFEQELRRVAVV